MMIVSVTRADLRDEFAMADEAFALSPISARAAQPREEDYDAISEAFMETSRGRWFLGEYAKRNRNADTRMVLDAVARIEASLAAQRQPAAEPDNGLAEALAAIRATVSEARTSATTALDGLSLEETLAPVRKGARIIREISWRWREIGADGRICDLLDSQVGAIEASCGQISSTGPREALSAAFDAVEQRIAEFGDRDAAAAPAAEATDLSPPPPPSDEMLAAIAEAAETTMAAESTEAATSASAMPYSPFAETMATAEAAEVTPPPVEAIEEAADMMPHAADAYDEAMLDMVALEMGAPDPIEYPTDIETDEIHLAESPPAEPEMVSQSLEPIPAPAQPPTAAQFSPEPSSEASPEISLGSSLIASGIVRRPTASQSDPLAAIRRMSQAEKVALFS
jgi:hypothetical protein